MRGLGHRSTRGPASQIPLLVRRFGRCATDHRIGAGYPTSNGHRRRNKPANCKSGRWRI